LQTVQYGETKTYLQIAQLLKMPKKVRAVANAIGKNPLLIIIPCHRIIGSDGKMHGYRGSLAMKTKLLTLERS
jgi:methylated-DNA-[protein]-cysteine S-methyltransferase